MNCAQHGMILVSTQYLRSLQKGLPLLHIDHVAHDDFIIRLSDVIKTGRIASQLVKEVASIS
jgi:hypothetical protein